MNTEIMAQIERTIGNGFLSSNTNGKILLKKPRQFVHDVNGEVCVTVSIQQSSTGVIILSANTFVAHELGDFFNWLDMRCYKYRYSDPGHCLCSL